MPLAHALRRLADAGQALAMLTLATMLVISLYEMFVRYLLSKPTTWAIDTTNFLLCLMVFSVLPRVINNGSSIAVTLLVDLLSGTKRRIAGLLIEMTCALVCLLVAGFFIDLAIQQFDRGISTNGNIQIPKWWLTAMAVYGFGLSGLLHVLRALSRQQAHQNLEV
jgi:TRAP-type C4-dicarboxylate transport system permease small subunit